MKLRFALTLFLAIALCFSASGVQAAAKAPDKRLEGVVDLEKLILSMNLSTFSGDERSKKTDEKARALLAEAGWIPNAQGVFTLRMKNTMLTFRGDDKLPHFYILPFTRPLLASKKPRPAMTGSFVVVTEDLEGSNYAKMSGFGYIGRGSHTRGTRYGILPFNQDFIRLLVRDKITSYVFTLTDVDVEACKERRKEFELFFKCRFSNKTHDYLRRQDNVKLSSFDSPNSRRVAEYFLCVDVVGAFLYNTKSERVVREWAITP